MDTILKRVLTVIVFLTSLLAVCLIIYFVANSASASPLENTLFSVLLTVFSIIFSWVSADFYAKASSKRESSDLIDRIGEQSSEKILNQSRQLWNIETYLENKRREMSNDPAKSEYYEFLGSIIEMLKLVRSSNNTYLSDWAGVTSDSIRSKIDSQSRAQAELFEDIDLLVKSDFHDDSLKNRIIANSKKLPGYLTTSSNTYDGKKVSIIRTEYKHQTRNKSQGRMTVYVNQPMYAFTCSGKLEPAMSEIPNDTRARLDEKPKNMPKFYISCSAGTTFDFHIHIKSAEPNVLLPIGMYIASFVIQNISGEYKDYKCDKCDDTSQDEQDETEMSKCKKEHHSATCTSDIVNKSSN